MNVNYYTPTLTFFNEDGSFDKEGNRQYLEYLLKEGIKGFVVLGSTSEFYAMTKEEKIVIIDFYVNVVNKRAKLIVGTGGMSLEETIELSNYAKEAGADAVIVMSPFFHPFGNDTIKYYYGKVAENIDIDMYLYNFPDRTGYNLNPELTLELASKYPNIVGYKDSSRGIAHTKDLINIVKRELPNFEIYSGWDDNFLFNVIAGGDGCMGAISNLFPNKCSEWASNFNQKNYDEAINTQRFIDKAMEIYYVTNPFMITFKNALKLSGFDVKVICKEPQIKIDETNNKMVKKILKI